MGVHGLWRLLECFGEEVNPESLRGQRVAIDASVWISQFRSLSGMSECSEQRVLDGFLQRILKLLYYGIEPVFVFDGAASASKAAELRRRQRNRAEQQLRLVSRHARQILMAQSGGEMQARVSLLTGARRDAGTGTTVKSGVPQDAEIICKRHRDVSCTEPVGADSRDRLRAVCMSSPARRQLVRDNTPEGVSVASTSVFLRDVASFLNTRQKGERKTVDNMLWESSSSLFMGPRTVLEANDGMKWKHEEVTGEVQRRLPLSSAITLQGSGGVKRTSPHGADADESSVSIVEDDTDSILSGSDSVEEVLVESRFPPSEEETFLSEQENFDFLWLPLTPSESPENTGLLGEAATIHSTPISASKGFTEVIHSESHSFSGASRAIPFDLLGVVELLDACGVPYLLSAGEADAQCADLCRQGAVDAVFSEDSDIIVHGPVTVLRGFFSNSKKVRRYRQDILESHGVTKGVLVALALLLGCDYATGVVGVGLVRALHILAVCWVPHRLCETAADVLEVLERWKTLVCMPCPSLWTNTRDMSPLQHAVLRDHHQSWQDLTIPSDFPCASAVEAFFCPSKTEQACVTPSVLDWNRLKRLAHSKGLLSSRHLWDLFRSARKSIERSGPERDGNNSRNTLENMISESTVRQQWPIPSGYRGPLQLLKELQKCVKA